MNPYRIFSALLLAMALFPFASCSDNSTSPGGADNPTMANIWPHADGSSWRYTASYSERFATVAAAATSLPEVPLPSMIELYAMMQTPLTGEPSFSGKGFYQLSLTGEVTTQSGVKAQRMVEELYLEPGAQGSATRELTSKGGADLRQMITGQRPEWDAKASEPMVTPPIFLGGYAFAFEDSGYYGYGDLSQAHSFIYLDKSLAVGAEFSIQLAPGLANDIWLKGQIWSRGTLRVGDTTYRNVVECLYVIDLGPADLVNENGEVIGATRSYISAITHFAPDVGPIKGHERHYAGPGNNAMQDPSSSKIREYQMTYINE